MCSATKKLDQKSNFWGSVHYDLYRRSFLYDKEPWASQKVIKSLRLLMIPLPPQQVGW